MDTNQHAGKCKRTFGRYQVGPPRLSINHKEHTYIHEYMVYVRTYVGITENTETRPNVHNLLSQEQGNTHIRMHACTKEGTYNIKRLKSYYARNNTCTYVHNTQIVSTCVHTYVHTKALLGYVLVVQCKYVHCKNKTECFLL